MSRRKLGLEQHIARERAQIDAAGKREGVRYRRIDAIPDEPLPKGLAQLAGEDGQVAVAGTSALVARRTKLACGDLILVAGGAREKHPQQVHGACLSRDGVYAYAIASNHTTVFRTEVATPSIYTVLNAPDRLSDVALVDDRYLFAGGFEGTHVVDLQAIERGAFDKLAGTCGSASTRAALGSVLGGRVVWLSHNNFRKTTFATIEDGKLVRLATLDIGAEVFERDGQLYGQTSFHAIAIDGIAEALAARAAAPPRKVKASKLELREVAEPVAYPEPSAAWKKKVGGKLIHYRIGGARDVGWDGARLRWLDDEGRARTYAPVSALIAYEADANGRIVVGTYHEVTLVDANSGAAKQIASLGAVHVKGIAFAPDDTIAVLCERDLRLLSASGRALHRVPLGRALTLWGLRGGSTLAVTLTWCKHPVEVFAVVNKKLVRRLRSTIEASQAYVVADRYFVQAQATARWFELTS